MPPFESAPLVSITPSAYAERAQVARSAQIDRVALAEALRAEIRGDVGFDDGSRALYATDGSNYRQVPVGVVLPRDVEDVVAVVTICRRFHAPLLCRGGGTSLAGQCCNLAGVVDFSKYMAEILEVDPVRPVAQVNPGEIIVLLCTRAD